MNSFRSFFVALCAILAPVYSWTQSQQIEDLKKQVQNSQGVERVHGFIEIAELSMNLLGQFDSLISYAELALKESNDLNYTKGKYHSLILVSIGYARMNELDRSTDILKKILSNKTEIKDEEIIADVHFQLGFNAYVTNDLDQAMNNFSQAASIYTSLNDKENLALCYCRIAVIFSTIGQIEKCIQYIEKAIKLVPQLNSNFTIASIYSTAAGQFIQIGVSQKEYLDSAIHYGEKALAILVEDKIYSKVSQVCNSISLGYNMKGDSEKSLHYLQYASSFSTFLSSSERVVTLFNLCDFYSSQLDYESSLMYLDSINLLLQKNPDPYYEMLAAERIYAYNKESQNYETSVAGLEKYIHLKDSLFTIEQSKNINDISEKYETKLKDAEITTLHQKNDVAKLRVVILVIGIISALLILFLISLFFYQSLQKQKKEINETQERLNRSRMNPHFFFNALTSIQTLVLQEKKSDEVANYLAKLSKLMRHSLESTFIDYITLEQEIEFLTKYLDLQKFHLNDLFSYSIKIDDQILADQTVIPTMLIQPFLENSIEHGFKGMKSMGEIEIAFKRDANILVITIRDNGKNNLSDSLPKEFPSRSGQIIKDRLFLLNKKHHTSSGYKLEKRQDGDGMIVTVHLPYLTA